MLPIRSNVILYKLNLVTGSFLFFENYGEGIIVRSTYMLQQSDREGKVGGPIWLLAFLKLELQFKPGINGPVPKFILWNEIM